MRNIVAQPIVVVEDEPNDVLLLRRALSRARLANVLEVFDNGEAAMAYLTGVETLLGAAGTEPVEEPPTPALILLDLKLPRKSGFEVLEWLIHRPALARIPVAVFTSSAQSPDVQRARALGASSYLVKPITVDGIAEMVRDVGLSWLVFQPRSQRESE